MPTFEELLKDSEFKKLSFEGQRQVMSQTDKDFASMSPEGQKAVLARVSSHEVPSSTTTPYPTSFGMPAGNFFEKAMASGVNYFGNFANMILHPVDTVTSLANVAKGFDVKIRDAWAPQAVSPEDQGYKKYADAFVNFLGERYGGLENIQRTAENDPVGFVADVSGFLSGIGAAASKIPQLASVANVVSSVGAGMEPLNAAKQILRFIPEGASTRLYASAIKGMGGNRYPWEIKKDILATGLKEGIIPTERGLNTLQNKIDTINTEMNQILKQAGKTQTIRTDAVLSRLDELKDFYSNTIAPSHFLNELETLAEEFRLTQGKNIPVEQAALIKKNTYALLRKQYGEMKGVVVEGQKNIARGIREELVNLYPNLGTLGNTERELINLEKVINIAVGRMSNRELISMPTSIGGVTALAMGQRAPLGAIGWLTKAVVDNPTVKAHLAIALDKAKKIQTRNAFTTGRQIGTQAGRIEQSQEIMP